MVVKISKMLHRWWRFEIKEALGLCDICRCNQVKLIWRFFNTCIPCKVFENGFPPCNPVGLALEVGQN